MRKDKSLLISSQYNFFSCYIFLKKYSIIVREINIHF